MKIKFKNEIFDIKSELINGKLQYIDENSNISNIEIEEINENQIVLYINNEKYDYYLAQDKNNIYLTCNGNYYTFTKISDDDMDSEYANTSVNSDTQIVFAPMPGNIVKLLVREGDMVSEGTALLVVEAMKMETTIYANIDGIVETINVNEGKQVDSDTIIMIVKSPIE